jgi:signal transduction histidine kinase
MQRNRIERRLDIQFPPPRQPLPLNPELVEETKGRILLMLLIVNSGIFVFSGALGYLLAGRTLLPIQIMVDDQHRFISDASHELKTPLTSLKTAFEVYLRDKSRTLKDADTVITESVSEVNNLQSLSESLLTLAQNQTNGKSLALISQNLSTVITAAINQISSQAKSRKIKLSSDLTDIDIWGDKKSLASMFVILLDNAVKYSPNGKRVKIKSYLDGKWAVTDIYDQGIGISAADLPHIFDRFYRSDTARSKTTIGGYGLGLAIAKSIVDLHHGTITVKSYLGEGSVFTVCLPKLNKNL